MKKNEKKTEAPKQEAPKTAVKKNNLEAVKPVLLHTKGDASSITIYPGGVFHASPDVEKKLTTKGAAVFTDKAVSTPQELEALGKAYIVGLKSKEAERIATIKEANK